MTTNSLQPVINDTLLAARVEHASKEYGIGPTAVCALDDVTVSVPAGRFTAVMGPSGSGKSTLLHCMAGLDTLTSGHAFVSEVELGRLRDHELTLMRRTQVGFVFQSFNLLPTLTALENITLPLRLAGTRPDRDWLDQVIDTVGLRDRLQHRPAELSGGQQQRVAVARALVTRPTLIFADEPTGNLDSRSGSEILGFLARATPRARPDRGHGDPRQRRRELRRYRVVPRRRADGRGAEVADREPRCSTS